MGRLGWMGARAEYSRWGRDNRSHIYWSQQARGRSKYQVIFLTLLFGGICRKSLRRRPIGGICGRFFGRHGRRGIIQGPAHGSVIGGRVKRRRFLSGRFAGNRGKWNRRRGGRGRDRGEGVGLSGSEQVVAAGGT